jgi:prepilin-type N-terminal cleavage/methylation domain-containing protein
LTEGGFRAPFFLRHEKKEMKRKSGFTLIEMLITIAVMGAIAVIALPQYSKYVAKSRQQDAKGQLMAIRQAQEVYKLQYGSYTTATVGLSGWVNTLGSYTFAITAADTTTFSASATGNIDGDATLDVWTIDQDGAMPNTTNDVDN